MNNNLIEILRDIIRHTHGLGISDIVKINGTDLSTSIYTIAEDRSVFLNGILDNVVTEFVGEFGMPYLGNLNTILKIPEYNEKAVINVVTQKVDNDDVPCGLNLANVKNDFKNSYRFMRGAMADHVLRKATAKLNPRWQIELVPNTEAIKRIKYQSVANNGKPTFVINTEDNNLIFNFGESSNNSGSFIFSENVGGSLTKSWAIPTTVFMGIMNLGGSKLIKISDEGLVWVSVKSDYATYDYSIPAHITK